MLMNNDEGVKWRDATIVCFQAQAFDDSPNSILEFPSITVSSLYSSDEMLCDMTFGSKSLCVAACVDSFRLTFFSILNKAYTGIEFPAYSFASKDVVESLYVRV